jgi:hypothetical protein
VAELRDTTATTLRTVLPGHVAMPLRVISDSPQFHGRYDDAPDAPDAPDELVHAVHGDGSPLLPAYLLVTTDGAAVAEVSEYDVGAYEDPDGGRRLVVSRDYYRRPGDRHRRLRHPTTASTLETAAAEALSAAWIS